jgi:uncharacterized protein YecE (DUF72 family)
LGRVLIGCSGWSYPDKAENGGWTKAFYPDTKTKRLSYYSQYFNTAEIDSTFYEKFYMYMTKDIFFRMAKSTPEDFQFSVKVPETVTHKQRLSVQQGAISSLEDFLDKISPLNEAKKLGAVLIQLPPSFTVKEFSNTEAFMDRLPKGYEYALEFRHPSWETEGPWEMLKHYNIATVMTDSPPSDNLQFLSKITVTANHSFIRWHGRNAKYRYNYLYSKEELKPWIDKIRQIEAEVTIVRGYFNNHYGAKAIVNAFQFRDALGENLSANLRDVYIKTQDYLSENLM